MMRELAMKGKLLVIAVLVACFSGCTSAEEYLELTSDGGVSLPYFQDFEDGEFACAQNLYPAFKWQMAEDSDNSVLKCAAVNEDETICGNSIYTLAVGDPFWEDYTLSFEFRITEGAMISFAPYMETNVDTSEDSQMFESANPWILTITSKGELWYETMFSRGTHSICALDGFVADGWNSVRLTPEGTKLMMSFNGAEIGAVAELADGASGRIGIGGTVGLMIDNISAEHCGG